MLFSRLSGQETEYAIRFSPDRARPGNDLVYEAVAKAIGEELRTERGMSAERPQIFLENGGAFHYEHVPFAQDGGLVEGATPECRGPAQLLLYQRAQEALLRKVLPRAEARLRYAGYPGTLGLLKNCKDAEGHVYGAQESYEVSVGSPLCLLFYRLGLAVLAPVLALTFVVHWAAMALLLVFGIAYLFAALLLSLAPRSFVGLQRFFRQSDRAFENRVGGVLYWLNYAVTWPYIAPFTWLVRLFAFRGMRRDLTPFLVTRSVYSGAGTVEADGELHLSEKASTVRRLLHYTLGSNDRAIYDVGNLLKPMSAVFLLRLQPFASLFRGRLRMQLGLADSNVLDEAEFLKMGATALVVDMIEAGALERPPRMWRPVRALHAVAADPTLKAVVRTRRGPMTALEIQRYYLDEAKRFVRESQTKSMEAEDVLRLWEDVLAHLENERLDELVGRLDWVTKRYLLETCGGPATDARLKTIDLRYHELGDGYAARLAEAGYAKKLVRDADIERAMKHPPEGTPAFLRGKFIRERRLGVLPVRISWDAARIGGRLDGKVVRFPGPSG